MNSEIFLDIMMNSAATRRSAFIFFCEVIAQKKRQPVSSFGVVPMAPRRKSGEAPMKRLKSGHNLEDCFAGKFPATRTFTTWLYHPWFFWIYLQWWTVTAECRFNSPTIMIFLFSPKAEHLGNAWVNPKVHAHQISRWGLSGRYG